VQNRFHDGLGAIAIAQFADSPKAAAVVQLLNHLKIDE
jgi:hypothetical protein